MLMATTWSDPLSVGSRHPFLSRFVDATGFYTISRELIEVGAIKRAHMGASPEDVESCLLQLTAVLEEEKAKREAQAGSWFQVDLSAIARGGGNGGGSGWWSPPVPVFYLDELRSDCIDAPTSTKPTEDVDKDMAAFVRWATFVTDNQLAHVLLVARPDTSAKLDRLYLAFSARRSRIVIDFVAARTVEAALAAPEADGGVGMRLADARLLAETIGGQLKDLRCLLHAVKRSSRAAWGAGDTSASVVDYGDGGDGGDGGALADLAAFDDGSLDYYGGDDADHGRLEPARQPWHWQHVHRLLLEESREFVQLYFEGRMDRGLSANASQADRIALLKQGVRLYDMMKLLAARGTVERRELSATLFGPGGGSQTSELATYIEDGLLAYAEPPLAETLDCARSVNETWMCAASPRLRTAFKSLVIDERTIAYLEKAKVELRKAELLKRIDQLAKRRNEQSRAERALAHANRSFREFDDEIDYPDSEVASRFPEEIRRSLIYDECEPVGDRITHEIRNLQEEIEATAKELRRARAAYDMLKWKVTRDGHSKLVPDPEAAAAAAAAAATKHTSSTGDTGIGGEGGNGGKAAARARGHPGRQRPKLKRERSFALRGRQQARREDPPADR
eukprot:g4231.t1